jgi:hypothetical protein
MLRCPVILCGDLLLYALVPSVRFMWLLQRPEQEGQLYLHQWRATSAAAVMDQVNYTGVLERGCDRPGSAVVCLLPSSSAPARHPPLLGALITEL